MELEFELRRVETENAPQKATANDMIAKMEQASQVTIVESDYWKALINQQKSESMLNSILETKPTKK